MGELDPGEAAMIVDERGRAGEIGNVLLVPQPYLLGDVAGRMDVALLGADHRPAALGLDAAHDRHRRRPVAAHAVAMRHLEEAVARRHRTDAQLLEQHVVAPVAGHRPPPPAPLTPPPPPRRPPPTPG